MDVWALADVDAPSSSRPSLQAGMQPPTHQLQAPEVALDQIALQSAESLASATTAEHAARNLDEARQKKANETGAKIVSQRQRPGASSAVGSTSPPKAALQKQVYKRSWAELTKDQKKAAIVLGWGKITWDKGASTYATARTWGQLKPDQLSSARKLGYNLKQWESRWAAEPKVKAQTSSTLCRFGRACSDINCKRHHPKQREIDERTNATRREQASIDRAGKQIAAKGQEAAAAPTTSTAGLFVKKQVRQCPVLSDTEKAELARVQEKAEQEAKQLAAAKAQEFKAIKELDAQKATEQRRQRRLMAEEALQAQHLRQ